MVLEGSLPGHFGATAYRIGREISSLRRGVPAAPDAILGRLMSDEVLPAPESCAHNLHRTGDGRNPRPEPVDLCRNALGMFHMLDCPLTVGMACVYYEASPAPHAVTSDLELEAAREELQGDFLGWRYRRRVRWLTKPKNLVPVPIVVEGAAEVEEVVPDALPMREPPPPTASASGAEAPPAAAVTGAEGAAPASASAPAAPAAPERYPGQRRSEERLAKKRARLAALDAAAAAAKAAAIAALAEKQPAEPEAPADADEDEGPDGSGFGDGLGEDAGYESESDADDEAPEDPRDAGPKTVEEVLAALPDAPVAAVEPRRDGQQRRDGPPRRRRRRGRRGRGGPPGPGGPGGGGPQHARPPRGPRPPGGPPR